MKSDLYLVYTEHDRNNDCDLAHRKDLKLLSHCLRDRLYPFDIDNRVNVFMPFTKPCVQYSHAFPEEETLDVQR